MQFNRKFENSQLARLAQQRVRAEEHVGGEIVAADVVVVVLRAVIFFFMFL